MLNQSPEQADRSIVSTPTSSDVIVSAPMSFSGSARRIWRLTRPGPAAAKLLTVPVALVFVLLAWAVVTVWYAAFGILLWPYRLIRRGQRKDRVAALRHRELLEAGRS